MAYNELIKNFNRIRDYMKEFYVYGFKSRGDFTQKSARSYDDEKKVKIYEHFGMKMVREHVVSDRAIYYEMLREST